MTQQEDAAEDVYAANLVRGAQSSTQAHEAVRRYLARTLPWVPIVTFAMSFLYCYLLVGIGDSATPPVGPALLGAGLMAATTGMLCLSIYLGVVRRSGEGV